MKNNPIGICLWTLPGQDPASLGLAAGLGYKGVELDLGLQRRAKYSLRIPAVRQAFARMARIHGLSFPSMALNGIPMNDPSREKFCLAAVDSALEAAQDLSIPLLQMPSFFDCGMNTEEEFASTVRILSYACRRAESLGVVIASENQLDTAGNLRLIREVDHPLFAIYFDTGNPIWLDGRDAPEMLVQLLPYIRETHVKDLHLVNGGYNRPLGQGDCRFAESMTILRDSAYAGWIIDESEVALKGLENNVRTLRGFFCKEAE